MITGSDGSTDNTGAIIRDLQKKYPSLKLTEFTNRTGKPGIINRLALEATGEILIITDANVIPEKNTIRKLMGLFQTLRYAWPIQGP